MEGKGKGKEFSQRLRLWLVNLLKMDGDWKRKSKVKESDENGRNG